MLSCCRAAPAAPAVTGRDKPSDPALNAFDRLRVREVEAEYKDTAATFLARFQSAAASLGPDERIELAVANVYESVELLKAVLVDPHSSKICALYWWYSGQEDVNSVIPLLINRCPELASLQVDFEHLSELDFVSSVLEHPRNKVKVLEVPLHKKGKLSRFFAALAQSQVSALTLTSNGAPELYHGVYEYLEKDLLVRLEVSDHSRVPSEMMVSLANCTCLVQFTVDACIVCPFAHLSKSITKLGLRHCLFPGDFDWSFLVGSSVRELELTYLKGVDGNQLGGALAVRLRAKGFDRLCLANCYFVNETLAAVGVDIGRIKRLILEHCNLNDASNKLIALTLQSPNSEMRELRLPYYWSTGNSIESLLVPALKQTNCSLDKLSFWIVDPEHEAAAKAVEDTFRNRRALLVLLQGQQVRRKVPCLLKRLPVEMLRMVGMVLV